MTQEELYNILSIDESYRIERTISTNNMDKFQEAICAFANDLPGSRKKGYLLIGVLDDGRINGMSVDDTLMKKISGIRSDGNILPLPMMTTEKVSTPKGDVLVVEVTPSFDTPVRYRGRTFIRIGPRRDIATPQEERILSERCAASLPTFDTYPCRGAKLDDLDINAIIKDYLPRAVDNHVWEKDHRPLEEQLASLHLWNLQWNCPTNAAMIMFGKNPKFFMPGAYIQYVRFKGETNAGAILNERRFEDCLYKTLPLLDNFIRDGIVTRRPISISMLREKEVMNYPFKALHELCMNACMHRDYQSNMPTRLYQYDRHIEIMNPGGLYGQARPENFPLVNDYRNSVIAEMMRTFNYVNMFNHGVTEVQDALRDNENPPARFNVDLVTAFSAIIEDDAKSYEESILDTSLTATAHQLATNIPIHVRDLIINIDTSEYAKENLQLATKLATKSRQYFDKVSLKPAILSGLIQMKYADAPNHPNQRYRLTELGKAVQMILKKG